jgi:hypothetical protein
MLDVKTQACKDHILTTHFNERKSALHHMKVANPDDILLFDRGYYSRSLASFANEAKLKVVFRLKVDAFLGVRQFFNSNRTKQSILFLNNNGTRSCIYLIKYIIDHKKYVCFTNFDTNANEVRELYKLRWKVETSFRRLKTNLNLEVSHSMTPSLYSQEVDARVLLDTMNVLTNPICSYKNHNVKRDIIVTYFMNLDKLLAQMFTLKILHENKLPYKIMYFEIT